jgi:hypothetical protein
MKTLIPITTALALLTVAAQAQSYSCDWHAISTGGGTSTGGIYSVCGTIGQPDAGTLTGGSYSLVGGFWSIVQQEGAPVLKMTVANGNLVLSWPTNAIGFFVQSAIQLTPGSANWANLAGTPVQVGDHFELTIDPALTPPNPIRFFRLYKP